MDNRNIDWRIWTAVAGAVLAGFGSGTISRTDPFTGTEGRAAIQELRSEIRAVQTECNLQVGTLRNEVRTEIAELPFPYTKERIVELENFLREKEGYKPPTYRWR